MAREKINGPAAVPNDDNFTFSRFVMGLVAVQIAFGLTAVWYFVFSCVLLLPLVCAIAVLGVAGWDVNDAFMLVALVISPLSIAFLRWMMVRFVGPIYLGVIGRIKLVQFHRMRVDDALDLVRAKRQDAKDDLLKLMGWLRVLRQ